MSKNIIKQYINTIKGKNIHVLGASGAEGASIIEFLYNHGVRSITAHDFQDDPKSFRHRFKQTHTTLSADDRVTKLKTIINQDIKLCLKNEYLNGILDADLIFLTQAWFIYPPNFPIIKQCLDKKIPVSSLTKLYFDLSPCPIIGITGSQGKSTTTALTTSILDSANLPIHTAGNERSMYEQILDRIENYSSKNLIILEISNRQLTIDLQRSPHIAVITNIHPNHIEEHGSYQKYIQAKQSILRYQTDADYAVLNYDNPHIRKMFDKTKANIIPFSLKKIVPDGVYLKNKTIYLREKPLIDINKIKLLGTHNLANIMASIAVAHILKISEQTIIRAIENFPGIPHRLEIVADIDGVTYIDDLKSTSPTSTISAIKTICDLKPNNLFLIIGGNHKQVPHQALAKQINQNVTHLFTLPGSTTKETLTELKKIHSKIIIKNFSNIHELIAYTNSIAKKGDIILMSPAGTNFQEIHLQNKYSLHNLIKNHH